MLLLPLPWSQQFSAKAKETLILLAQADERISAGFNQLIELFCTLLTIMEVINSYSNTEFLYIFGFVTEFSCVLET